MGIVPGQDPITKGRPLLNEEPVPPGVEDLTDDVDEMERRARRSGPAEVERADRQADAVEGDRGHEEAGDEPDGVRPGSRSDADQDPTTDETDTDTPA